MTNQLKKIKEDWFKLGYHDSDVPKEYKKFGKEWNSFDKGFRSAKLDGWSFIEKVYSQAKEEGRREGIKEAEKELENSFNWEWMKDERPFTQEEWRHNLHEILSQLSHSIKERKK